jgi:spermidine synthase
LSEITYRIVKRADLNQLVTLYRTAGWWSDKNDNIEFLAELVRNTYLFVAAYDGEDLIGMGRSVSDGVSDAYIQDVTVLPRYRKRGIGGKIIQTLIENLQAKGINWIGLIGEPGTRHFYEELGFSEMKDYLPMLYKGKR